MKKWKLILIAVITAVILICISAFAIFHFYIVPRYIEPMLKTAADILKDDEIQAEISQAAREFAQKGLIDNKLVDDYENRIKPKSGNEQDSAQENKQDTSQNGLSGSAENSVGAKNIKVQDGEEKKYSYGKKNTEASLPDAGSGALNDDEQRLFDKVKSEVSSKDLSRAYEIIGKLDMSQVRSLLSDRAALKQYVKSVLSEEEYSEAIELYLKYAYLIQ